MLGVSQATEGRKGRGKGGRPAPFFMALDKGAVKPDTSFLDTGVFEIGGVYIYNWNSGAWGPQTMEGCLQHSLNVCLAWVAIRDGGMQRAAIEAELFAVLGDVVEDIVLAKATLDLLGWKAADPFGSLVPVEDLPVPVDKIDAISQVI